MRQPNPHCVLPSPSPPVFFVCDSRACWGAAVSSAELHRSNSQDLCEGEGDEQKR